MSDPKLTATSSLIDDPVFWSLLMKRLSGGMDAAYDVAVLQDLQAKLHIPMKAVIAKMKAHCHPSTGAAN